MGDKVNTVIGRIEATGLFNLQAGIEYCGDEEGYVEILEQSPYTFESSLKNLGRFFDNGLDVKDESNLTEYRVVAHSIKSTARLLGYDELSEIGRISEFAVRDFDIDKAIENHPILVDRTKEAIEMIYGFFEGVQDEDNPVALNPEELSVILNAMLEAAEDFDIDGMDECMKKLKSDGLPEAVVKRREELISAVANIDTDSVIELVNSIIEEL